MERGSAGKRLGTYRWLLAIVAVVVLLTAARAVVGWVRVPMLDVVHAPAQFARRAGDLSINICGTAFEGAKLRYQLNDGPWRPLQRTEPRTPKPYWTLELLPAELAAGDNTVRIEAQAPFRTPARRELTFRHDPDPVTLPMVQDWSGELDVQDGVWQTAERGDTRVVQPRPGTEGYDRLLLASGAFAGGRRVETTVTFGSFKPWEIWAGFGILTMWGGHLEDQDQRPRRGWRYAIAWYMKPYGPWCEFSTKVGGAPRVDSFVGDNWPDPTPGDRFRLIAECWPEVDDQDNHVGHRQRMKLWREGEPEPANWLVSSDDRSPLPPGEYAVALLAHECQVEFGPVRITRLPTRHRPPPATPRD